MTLTTTELLNLAFISPQSVTVQDLITHMQQMADELAEKDTKLTELAKDYLDLSQKTDELKLQLSPGDDE